MSAWPMQQPPDLSDIWHQTLVSSPFKYPRIADLCPPLPERILRSTIHTLSFADIRTRFSAWIAWPAVFNLPGMIPPFSRKFNSCHSNGIFILHRTPKFPPPADYQTKWASHWSRIPGHTSDPADMECGPPNYLRPSSRPCILKQCFWSIAKSLVYPKPVVKQRILQNLFPNPAGFCGT